MGFSDNLECFNGLGDNKQFEVCMKKEKELKIKVNWWLLILGIIGFVGCVVFFAILQK